MIKGFKEFITRGNVVDLAVGVVIGAAFSRSSTRCRDGHHQPDSSPPSSESRTCRERLT